jgi:excisionase family DNA binding protein
LVRVEISAVDAAERLGLDVVTVRRRAARGEIDARKVGNSWLFSDGDVAAQARQPHRRGRRLSPRSAWAVLDVLSGAPLDGLSRSEQTRARVRAADAASLSPADLGERALTLRLRGPKGARQRVAHDARVVRGGVSASHEAGLGLVAPDLVEGYIRAEEVDAVIYALALSPAPRDRADIILRVPQGRWPFGDAAVVPPAVAAADVLDAGDGRSIDAARTVLARLAHQVAT